ncbi:MAG TPA: PPC domain-containing protein [Gemmatimonadales bacterium]|nr:PPC domain-containing protein [Gemmatimonadales bacterium]
MRGLTRATPIVILTVTLGGVTCAFPTDKSDKVFVTLESPSHVVLRGQEISVLARAWQVTGSDTQPITNVDFMFTSGSTSIARVDKDCCGYATVTGVNSGTVDIVARAVSFEQAGQADLVLRVSNPLEIDSVRPLTAKFGELLTVYGIGVDSIFVASLGGVNLIEYPFSRVRDSLGLGQIKFWIPPPARTDSLFYLGAGVFGFDTSVTAVDKEDVFEPNDSVPAQIDLDLGGPWPGTVLDPVLFANPALSFEPLSRSTVGQDWFRFSATDTTQPLTFFITYPSVGDTGASATNTFLLDSLAYNVGAPGDPIEKFYGRDSVSFVGSEFYSCKGFEFDPIQVDRESTTVALKTLPSQAIHIVTFFAKPQRYGLTVVQGYVTADPRIKPDRFEENDFCQLADGQAINIPARATGLQFTDTLNIDNPFEIDWYRIEVPAPGVGDSIVFRMQARPFIAGRDTSDLDLYVLTVPGSTGLGVFEIAAGTNAGSSENLVVNLPAGSYYLAVVDYAGVAMRYSLCIRQVALVKTCNLILPSGETGGGSDAQKARPQRSLSAQAGRPARATPLFRRP